MKEIHIYHLGMLLKFTSSPLEQKIVKDDLILSSNEISVVLIT